ncbi:MAG: hypothetical protein JWM28_1474, partial [Chitinophagaceae bacterium]|nr:hypothetical protein [Chitinophagaceae bacterium]
MYPLSDCLHKLYFPEANTTLKRLSGVIPIAGARTA